MSGAGLLAVALLAGSPEILSATHRVNHIEATPDHVWVATDGGLEHYDPVSLERTRVYTTADGLAGLRLWEVTLGARVQVHTANSRCTLGADDRFDCEDAAATVPKVRAGDRFHGRRVLARASLGRREFVGTDDGLYASDLDTRRLTPDGQPCTNFAMALATHRDRLWMGAFEGGLCVSDDGRIFEPVDGPRMINDLLSHRRGLFVAANEGLFRVDDDGTVTPIAGIQPRGVNAVAWDGRRILATTPGALWGLDPRRDRAGAPRWMPGDTHALQDVTTAGDGTIWLASEDRGAIRIRGDEVRVFDTLAGLPSSWGLRVAVDHQGVAYLATLRNGLVKIDGDEVSAQPDLPDTWILETTISDGNLLVGTQGGAAVVAANGTVEHLRDLPHPNVHAFAPFRGKLYVATESGTAVYGGAKARNRARNQGGGGRPRP